MGSIQNPICLLVAILKKSKIFHSLNSSKTCILLAFKCYVDGYKFEIKKNLWRLEDTYMQLRLTDLIKLFLTRPFGGNVVSTNV